MALATGSQADLGYYLETTYGTAPTGVLYNTLRRKSAAGLNLTKDAYDSEEIRTDRMLADSRHGVRRAGGDIETELSPRSYDIFFLALLGYAAGNATNSDTGWLLGSTLTTTQTVTFVAATNKITLTSGVTTYRVGDRITISGAVDAGNNASFTVIGIVGNDLFVDGVIADETADTGVTIVVAGKKAMVGSVYNSFTLERAYTDIDKFQYFTGMRVNSLALSLPPTGLATATWNFLGKDASPLASVRVGTDSPYASVSTNSVLAAVNGVLAITDAVNGARTLGVVTDLSFTVDNQLGGSEVVGKNVIPESLWGNTQMVSGKITVLFEDTKIYNLFEAESEASLIFRMDGPADQSGKFISFTFPRCKFNTGAIGDAVATGLPVEMEFRALLPRSTDTTVNPSQIVIQTSLT